MSVAIFKNNILYINHVRFYLGSICFIERRTLKRQVDVFSSITWGESNASTLIGLFPFIQCHFKLHTKRKDSILHRCRCLEQFFIWKSYVTLLSWRASPGYQPAPAVPNRVRWDCRRILQKSSWPRWKSEKPLSLCSIGRPAEIEKLNEKSQTAPATHDFYLKHNILDKIFFKKMDNKSICNVRKIYWSWIETWFKKNCIFSC